MRNEIFLSVHSAPNRVYLLAHKYKSRAEVLGDVKSQCQAHYYLAIISNWRNDIDSSFYHGRKSLEFATESDDAKLLSEGYNMMGVVYEKKGVLDSAQANYEKSLSNAKISGYAAYETRALMNLGQVAQTRGDYLGSIGYLRLAVTQCYQRNLRPYLPNLHLNLGGVYRLLEEFDRAEDEFYLGLDAARKNQNFKSECAIQIELGKLELSRGHIENAICWFEQSLEMASLKSIKMIGSKAAANLALAYCESEKLVEAANNSTIAVKIATECEDTVALAFAYYVRGEVELRRGNGKRAYLDCEKALKFAEKSTQSNLCKDIYNCLYQSSLKSGMHKEALRYYSDYIQLRDSLLNNEKAMSIARFEAKIEYQYKRQQDSIFQAAEQESAASLYAHELAIAEEKVRFGLLIGLLAGVLALGAGIAAFLFVKQNRKLAAQNVVILDQNDLIKESLQEKEVLLREVHHRVKNNLQLMASLLDMQSEKLGQQKAEDVILASKGRLQAMILIHQNLYQEANIANLGADGYLRHVVESVCSLYQEIRNVEIQFEIAALHFGVDIAVPIGLIVNELVTNAFKHAFDTSKIGKLSITLQMEDLEKCMIKIEDNGRGFDPNFDSLAPETLGLQLVKGLSRQLKGILEIGSAQLGGAKVTVIFPFKKL